MNPEGDSICVGNISNANVAIGAGASVTVINRLVQGLGDLPTQHDASVTNFLDYYIGAPDSPAPFGGRDADLAAYSRWLDNPAAPPYALLTAPAGKGKSAALVHGVLQIAPRPDVAVVFIPISDRFQINSESAVFAALYARLAHLHGERPTQAFLVDQYRGAFQDYLSRPLPDGRRLVIVLDGLDEAAGWEVRTGLFPTQAPPHLKVLVAAREVAGDVTWATRLGWRGPRDAVSLRLEGLSRAALDDVLHRMGNPLAGLPADFQLVDKLYELTDKGDPLLIGLYVEALRLDRDRLPDLRPENLLEHKPGLASFFDLWFERQEHLWRAERSPVDRRAVDSLLRTRAMAFGPLTAEDLVELAPETFSATAGVRRVAQALRRFLVGSGAPGSGYSFSHPRLAQYLG